MTKRILSWGAAAVMILGLLGICGAIWSNLIFGMHGTTISEWEAAAQAQQTAEEKAGKVARSLISAYEKWSCADEEVTALAARMNAAAVDISQGNGTAQAWMDAFDAWSAKASQINDSEDESLADVKKKIKSLNRTAKSVNDSVANWHDAETLIAQIGINPSEGIAALCIRWRQVFLWGGLALMLAGFFILPATRTYMNKHPQAVGYLFVAPALVFMLIFVAYPIFYNFVLSFKDVDITNINYPAQQNFVGMANFKALFTDVDKQMTGAIVNTLVFTVGSIFFQFIIGFLMALLFRYRFPLSSFVRGAIMISWLIPVTVSGLLFKFMFGMNGGIINQMLGIFGFEPIEWLYSVDYAMPAVIIANIWIGIPFNMILLLTGLTTIPNEVYESCDLDGATGLRRLFSITIPMIRPAIMSVLTLGFVYTFKVFDLVKVMTSGGPVNRTQLVSIYAYKLAFEKYEYSMGAAAGTVMFIILLIEGLFYIKAIKEDEVM